MAEQSFTTSNPPVPRQTPGAIAPQPIPTPTHGAGGSFTIISSTHMSASPDVAFTTLLDHPAWPSWNRFVRLVTVTSCPSPAEHEPDDATAATPLETAIRNDDGSRYLKKGMRMTFNVHLDPDNETSYTRQGMEVTLLEPYVAAAAAAAAAAAPDDHENRKRGWRVAWKAVSLLSPLLRTERVQEFVDDGRGGTEYTCWETMYGPLAFVVRLAMGKGLERGFRCWSEDLKARAEGIAAGTAPGTTREAGG